MPYPTSGLENDCPIFPDQICHSCLDEFPAGFGFKFFSFLEPGHTDECCSLKCLADLHLCHMEMILTAMEIRGIDDYDIAAYHADRLKRPKFDWFAP